MRRRMNGFDIFIIAVVVLGLVFLALKGLHRTGVTATQTRIVFELNSGPTQNAVAIAGALQRGDRVTVNAAGSWVPIGTLQSFSIGPYLTSVPNGKGGLSVASDPLQRTIHLVVTGQGAVSGKAVTINGNPFSIGQNVVLQEGGAQLTATIVGERVR